MESQLDADNQLKNDRLEEPASQGDNPLENGPSGPEGQHENHRGFTREEQQLWDNAKCSDDYHAVWRMANERRAREFLEQNQKAWSASEAGRLLKRLGQAYLAYKTCLEHDPHAAENALKFDELNQRIFDRMRTNVEKANSAPRCARIMAGGRRCRAPKVRGKKYCHMHLAMEEARPQKINLPSLDDANGIQVAIAKSAQALVDGKLEQKQASLLAYYLQLAVSNVGRVDFEAGGDWEEAEPR